MDYREALNEQLATDPEFKKQWDFDQPEREVILTLARARHQQGITQDELAQRSGIHQGELSKIENGKGNPTLKTMQKLARGLGMRLELRFIPLDEAQIESPILDKQKLKEGVDFLREIQESVPSRFSTMTNDEIRQERLIARGLATADQFD